MQETPDILPGGQKYVPGICILCSKPFNEESSGGYFYGHKKCIEDDERESNRKSIQKLIASCPPGTRFDLSGGAACD